MNVKPVIGGIIQNLENAIEELKDALSEGGVEYEEMSHETRQQRGQARTQRLNTDGTPDRRFKENRSGPTGQGRVTTPEEDLRLKENRSESAFGQTGRR